MTTSPVTYKAPQLYIGGKWRSGTAETRSPVINPATGAQLDELSHASEADLDEALRAVVNGQTAWVALPAPHRQKILLSGVAYMRARSDIIATLLTQEQGKPLAQSKGEIEGAAAMVQWYAEQSRRIYGRIIEGASRDTDIEVRKGPVGPCLLLSPWNMPVMLAARKIGGALSAGCACIIKPPEETPAAIAAVIQCFLDAGLPDGVINLVYGIPSQISTKLIASDVIRKISFTGSVGVGQELARLSAPGLKKLTLELGGHSPVLVLEDANVERAVEQLVAAKYRNSGQLCISPTRFFVHKNIYGRFVEAFSAAAAGMKIGNGLDAATQMGPLANVRRLKAMSDLVEANASHSRLVTGGSQIGENGYFFAPTVLAEVTENAPAMQHEPFGPVALMVQVGSLDEAIERANSTRFGLGAFVFTDSAKAQKSIVDRLEVGAIAVNSTVTSVAEAPFGGMKDSGYGYESGEEGLEGYLHTKMVHRTYQ